MSESSSRRFLRWGSALLFLLVGGASILVLEIDHRRLMGMFHETVPRVDNLHHARLRIMDAYLSSERLHFDDPTFEHSQPSVALDEAADLLRDLTTGRTGLLGSNSDVPLGDERLVELTQQITLSVASLRDDLAQGLTPDPVERRIAFGALGTQLAELERQLYEHIRERIATKRRRHQARVGGWIAFLLVLGGALFTLGRAQLTSDEARRTAQEKLGESERHFRQLAEHIPDVFWMTSVDDDEKFYISPAYEQLWGRPREELLERPWLESIHPEDRERVAAALPAQAEGTYAEEYRIILPDGQVRWVYDRAFPVHDDRGETYRVAGIAKDVTDRRDRTRKLTLLAFAIEQAGEGVIITDLDGTIEYVNPAFEAVTGYSREEAVGQNPRFLKSGEHDVEFYRAMWSTLLDGNQVEERMVNRRKDGSLYTHDSVITPVRSTGQKITHFVAVFRDVTDQITLEDQIRQAQKMEAVGRLAGGIAHDFNNVLTIIKGHVEFVLNDLGHSHVSSEDLEEVLWAAESAHAITRQLLTFSRLQGGEPKVIDLAEVIRGAQKMIRRFIRDDIELDVSLEADLGRVTADPTHIEQVLLNLAVNASDAMPQGGRLNIKAQNVTRKTEAVVPGFPEPMKPGRYVRLVFADTGTGMDEATRMRVFEPFFSTKPQGRGTGLGLSVVFGIVKQTGGYIRVLSAPGAGTTFEIHLPRADGEPTKHMERRGQSMAPVEDVSGSETVLIVEDQPGVRSMARRALERAGYGVLEAPNGVKALDVYEGAGGAVDLVLTDMVMPVMGGLELGERLRERDPELPVLFMSGYADDEITRHGVQRAEIHTIEKPFGPGELQRKVREVLDQARTGG